MMTTPGVRFGGFYPVIHTGDTGKTDELSHAVAKTLKEAHGIDAGVEVYFDADSKEPLQARYAVVTGRDLDIKNKSDALVRKAKTNRPKQERLAELKNANAVQMSKVVGQRQGTLQGFQTNAEGGLESIPYGLHVELSDTFKKAHPDDPQASVDFNTRLMTGLVQKQVNRRLGLMG